MSINLGSFLRTAPTYGCFGPMLSEAVLGLDLVVRCQRQTTRPEDAYRIRTHKITVNAYRLARQLPDKSIESSSSVAHPLNEIAYIKPISNVAYTYKILKATATSEQAMPSSQPLRV